MAHAKQRDPVLGWVLMVVRGICFFNPAVQLAARAAAREIERRADQSAARTVGSAEPVVRTMRKLSGSDSATPERALTWHGFRLAVIEQRCHALLHDPLPDAKAQSMWILAVAAIGLGVILFLTVA
jgi:beta-lactamase regulating signal transducer with metallopeptidase domain